MHRSLSRLTIVAALSAATILAQNPRMLHGPGAGAPPDPTTMIERRVSFLKTLLTLTDAQAAQATTIFTNALAAVTPLETSLSTARDSMRDAVKSNSTATIDQLSAGIGTLTGQIAAIQHKAEAAFYATLTADQKTKYDAVGGGGFGRGGPRGRGPR